MDKDDIGSDEPLGDLDIDLAEIFPVIDEGKCLSLPSLSFSSPPPPPFPTDTFYLDLSFIQPTHLPTSSIQPRASVNSSF